MVPLALELPPYEYFRPHTSTVLSTWLEQAKPAIAVHQVTHFC
jgi:hypothetical protein